MSQVHQFLSDGPLPPSPSRSNPAKWIALVVAVVAFVGLAGLAFLSFRSSAVSDDFVGPGSGEVVIQVDRGDSLSAIGRTLRDAGVVATADAFVRAATVNEGASSIGPGRYTMLQGMSGAQAVTLMLDPASRAQSRLVLPEGLRLEQTVEAAANATGLPKSRFKVALDRSEDLGLPDWAEGRPEGFMFPASYDLAGDETADGILQVLITRFNQASSQVNLEGRAEDRGITPYEALVIASLVQAEGHPNDFAKVARVIYNRLKADMPLQLDSTVAYGLGITDITLTKEQLAADTPYNTHTNKGLPPTPINSPGEAAIEAALEPAKGKWLYFVTVNPDTGETKFAKTYGEFLTYKKEFQDFIASQG